MKIFKIYAIAVSLLMLMVACGDDKPTQGVTRPQIEGNTLGDIEYDWKLVSVNGVEPEFTVYINFSAGIFNIYQQLYTLDYVLYDGEYSIKGKVVSGTYFDGMPWKSSYVGDLTPDGEVLTLVSNEENPLTCVYEMCEIPEEVITEATTRSAVVFDYHL